MKTKLKKLLKLNSQDRILKQQSTEPPDAVLEEVKLPPSKSCLKQQRKWALKKKYQELRKLSGWERIKLGYPAQLTQPVDLTYIRAPKRTKAQLLKRFYFLNRFQPPLGHKFFRQSEWNPWPDSTFRLYIYKGDFRISVIRNWDEDNHLVKLIYTDNFKHGHWICSSYFKGDIIKSKLVEEFLEKLINRKQFKIPSIYEDTLIPL